MEDKFLKAVEKVLAHEGGYVNDPDDPGGETNMGISKRSYPSLDIKKLTRQDAIDIYRRDWWDKYGYGAIGHEALAAKLLDLSVNVGPRRAHSLLQSAFNGTSARKIEVDGIIGPATIAAVNGHDNPEHVLSVLRLSAIAFYLRLRKPKYLAGWIERALS